MIKLGILLTKHHRLISVAAILDVFESANRFSVQSGNDPCFAISLLYPADTAGFTYGDFPKYTIENAPVQSLILIPAFAAECIGTAIQDNAGCIPWLIKQYNQGAEIASFCTGAFLLAATGLLNDKPATTHIQAAEAFSRSFPRVRITPREITTFENGIYTSGGATNSFHLMFSIIEKYCGKSLAIQTAKYFAVDLNREQQMYFSTFKPVTDHHDELVTSLQRNMETKFSEGETIEKLLDGIPASRRNLVRRFKGVTGITPIEYLQKTRMEAAKKLLEQSRFSILEIMLRVGYNDLKTFRQLFKKHTGMTPTAYRDKFTPRGSTIQGSMIVNN